MNTGLKGRVALVTGASQGLGKATARAFAAEGANLMLISRNASLLKALGDEIGSEFHVQVETDALDVRQADRLQQAVKRTAELFGRLDICVANAGGPPAKDFIDTSLDDWQSAFEMNLRSVVVLAQAAIPVLRERGWGRIVTITSMSVRQPLEALVLSNTLRTGILGLLRTLSNDYARHGITFNNVAPGYTATDRLKNLAERQSSASGKSTGEIENEWIRDIPAGRLAAPDEIADAVVWLASERASFITGQTIVVDGGMYKGV